MRIKWALVRESVEPRSITISPDLHESKEKVIELAREANAGLRTNPNQKYVYTVGEVRIPDEEKP
jgi:hypothetical protein